MVKTTEISLSVYDILKIFEEKGLIQIDPETQSYKIKIENNSLIFICTEKSKVANLNQSISMSKDEQEVFLSRAVRDLNISTGLKNSLRAADIETVKDVLSWDIKNIVRLRNFGKKRLEELQGAINPFILGQFYNP